MGTPRMIARAVYGDVTFRLLGGSLLEAMQLDEFTVDGKSENRFKTFVYDAPPPSLYIRVTESGPGGTNFQVMLIGQ